MILSCISFAFVPATGDIKVFLASANQSAYINNNLIVGAFSAWELKSVYSRVLFYLLYKIASMFFPYGSMGFEITVKAIYLLMVVACSTLCVNLIYGNHEIRTAERRQIIKLTIIAFTAMHTASHLQAEMTCAMIAFLSFAIWINARKTEKHVYCKLTIVGLLIGIIPFFKSVLILLAVSIVMAVFIYCDKKHINFYVREVLFVASVCIISILASALLIWIINPSEFKEILYASSYQSTLFSTGIHIIPLIKQALVQSCYNILYIPVGTLGIVALIFNLYYAAKMKRVLLILCHIVMWIMPWLFIILSNKYFAYHFAVFVFVAIVELMSLPNDITSGNMKILKISGLILCLFYVAFFSILSPNSIDAFRCNKQSYVLVNDRMKELNIDEDEEILFLDGGLGAYYIKNKSYSRYYYPLPLQRLGEGSELESAVQLFDEIKQYNGSYIVVDSEWFFGEGKNPTIERMINEKYEYQGDLALFSPTWSYKFGESKLSYCKVYKRLLQNDNG